MTSLTSYKAQNSTLGFYIVENNGGYMLNPALADFISIGPNTVLKDMGKTVFKDNLMFRKVQITSKNGTFFDDGRQGYICLNSDRVTIPGPGTRSLGVSKLN